MGGITKAEGSNSIKATVQKVIPHEKYSHTPYGGIVNDIALIQLTRPVTFSNTVQPICLPSATVDLKQFKVCFYTGYGQTSALTCRLAPSSDALY